MRIGVCMCTCGAGSPACPSIGKFPLIMVAELFGCLRYNKEKGVFAELSYRG
jgi:hypothetical protein